MLLLDVMLKQFNFFHGIKRQRVEKNTKTKLQDLKIMIPRRMDKYCEALVLEIEEFLLIRLTLEG
jgi:hypothetical protein